MSARCSKCREPVDQCTCGYCRKPDPLVLPSGDQPEEHHHRTAAEVSARAAEGDRIRGETLGPVKFPEHRRYLLNTAAALGEAAEYTGGSVGYYKVRIGSPTSDVDAYTAECNDIIEALGMNYAEGNAFKAIWRRCAARTLGLAKAGYKDGLYDAEKVVFFGERMVAQEKAK